MIERNVEDLERDIERLKNLTRWGIRLLFYGLLGIFFVSILLIFLSFSYDALPQGIYFWMLIDGLFGLISIIGVCLFYYASGSLPKLLKREEEDEDDV